MSLFQSNVFATRDLCQRRDFIERKFFDPAHGPGALQIAPQKSETAFSLVEGTRAVPRGLARCR